MTEAYSSVENVQLYYGDGNREGAHFAFNFILMEIYETMAGLASGRAFDNIAEVFNGRIQQWTSSLKSKYVSNWVVSRTFYLKLCAGFVYTNFIFSVG